MTVTCHPAAHFTAYHLAQDHLADTLAPLPADRVWTLSLQSKTEKPVLLQVLKGRLSVHQPTIMCDGFMYEEGEDLDEDELAANAANLPKMLQTLPGGVLSTPPTKKTMQPDCHHYLPVNGTCSSEHIR